METHGSIIIEGEIKPGMIKIGYGQIGVFDRKYSRSILEIRGRLIFRGVARIGQGCKINIGDRATLTIGDNFVVRAETTIACHQGITIGNGCLFSWQIQVMDTDFHKIKNLQGEIINPPEEIIIENNVWIGSRCTILKGSEIAEGTVIAACSTVNKSFTNKNVILGGVPAKILTTGISWEK